MLEVAILLTSYLINESKTLAKHISCKCKCIFDGRKCNSKQNWNNDKCRCECKKHNICENGYIWNPATCSWQNGEYLAYIMDNSVITCHEIIDAGTKTIPTKFNKNISIFQFHFY